MESIYDFTYTTIDGDAATLAPHRGKVLLIVNVASKCGFTPHYEGLEKLYRTYGDRGLVVVGFPCNQFKEQEPGTEREIRDFCRLTYGVTFPLAAKIDVNGPAEHPLYTFLKQRLPGDGDSSDITWNFTKFLVDRDGTAVRRYAPSTKPESIEDDIVGLLADAPA